MKEKVQKFINNEWKWIRKNNNESFETFFIILAFSRRMDEWRCRHGEKYENAGKSIYLLMHEW